MGHVPTEENYSDIFTKNTTEATFTKHAKALMDGDIKCFVNHQGRQYTREDVETDDDSWTPVVVKKKSGGIKDQHGRTKKFPGKDNPGASEKIRRLD